MYLRHCSAKVRARSRQVGIVGGNSRGNKTLFFDLRELITAMPRVLIVIICKISSKFFLMFCIRIPIFWGRRFNCPRAILKTVLESGSLMEKAILQFCSIFESRVQSVPVYCIGNGIAEIQPAILVSVSLKKSGIAHPCGLCRWWYTHRMPAYPLLN